MIFNHLVDPPSRHPGGVLFTVDQHAVQRTVFITDSAIGRLDPTARDDRAIVHAVMANIAQLVALAIDMAFTTTMPELIVLDEEHVSAAIVAR
jgi:hypothetical protein